jgi:hypothetical protein
MFVIIGSILVLLWFVCHIIVLVHAFQDSLVTGLLYLCVPCYAFYYVIFKFTHSSKLLIVICYFFGLTVGGSLSGFGAHNRGWVGDHPAHRR